MVRLQHSDLLCHNYCVHNGEDLQLCSELAAKVDKTNSKGRKGMEVIIVVNWTKIMRRQVLAWHSTFLLNSVPRENEKGSNERSKRVALPYAPVFTFTSFFFTSVRQGWGKKIHAKIRVSMPPPLNTITRLVCQELLNPNKSTYKPVIND